MSIGASRRNGASVTAFVALLALASTSPVALASDSQSPAVDSSVPAAPTFGDTAPKISQAELLQRMQAGERQMLLLDVRTPEEFAAGHVPGAINIPHDQLAARLDELAAARSNEIVTYCRSGKRAALALTTLHDAGFEQLQHLEGDFLAWQAAERPIEAVATSATKDDQTQH